MALPHLGGNSVVWTTCLLFFQTALLVGYLYAHLLAARVSTRAQLAIHAGLLVLASLSLPIRVPGNWSPASPEEPVPSLLGLLTSNVGVPFVLLAAGSPLLQHWLAMVDDPSGRDPYTLAVASNLGSVVGLLAYPIVMEPTLALSAQSRSWALGYGLLLVLWILCGRLAAAARRSDGLSLVATHTPSPTWADR